MAKKVKVNLADQFSSEPVYTTQMRSRLLDGRLMGVDNSLWVYREVPLGPVVDAADPSAALEVAQPIFEAFEGLAQMANGTAPRRVAAKSSYRDVHLLLVNVPQAFTPPRNHPIAGYLRRSFGRHRVDKRVLLFGVRLIPNVGGGEGGFKAMLDSVVETLTMGGVPLSDYDKDFKAVSDMLDKTGLLPVSDEAIHLANGWWNAGRNPDTPTLIHEDHLHFFTSVDAMRMANKIGVTECKHWDEAGITDQTAVTFASLENLDMGFMEPTDPRATWVSDLLDADALAVSIRGNVEPSTITRKELRLQKKRYTDDINERVQNGKMQLAEQNEMLEVLASVENFYGSGHGTPTLTNASVIVGLNGQREDLSQDIWQHSPVRLAPMLFRQPGAHAEMMLCSGVRANPNVHDFPCQTIAYSGLPSLSFVGDRDRNGEGEGAMLGLTQRDRQPAYLSPTSASLGDALPLGIIAGATGSGKRLALTERIPTPSGWTTMGELKVGDKVLSGDGKPCNVTWLSPVEENPELYRVVFDDGTEVLADAEHQWMVTDFRTRNRLNNKNGLAAVARRDEKRKDIDRILEKAETFDAQHESTVQDLFEIVTDVMVEPHWKTWFGVLRALDFVEAPYVLKSKKELGLSGGGRPLRVYNTQVGLKALAIRLDQSQSHRPLQERGEFRVTTGEMLDMGLMEAGSANFAIRIPVVEGEEKELPIDPYVLGLWLGDGSRTDGRIAVANLYGEADPDGLTDQDHALAFVRAAGFVAEPLPSNSEYVIAVKGLAPLLRQEGLLGNKHIPKEYLRASFDQRLALVQGLMDSDGCVTKTNRCVFTQKDTVIFDAFVEVVRSLGIKVTVRRGIELSKPTEDANGDIYRKPSGVTNEATFTTHLPVVRLPRKALRLPSETPVRQQNKYVKAIEPVTPEPARCITVDSPDHSYLCEGFTVTLNTMLLLNLADQYSRMGRPVIIIDPKALTLDTLIATPDGPVEMGEIGVGDVVFDRLGNPCTVTHKSRVFTAEESTVYEIVLTDGSVVRADANHQWITYDDLGSYEAFVESIATIGLDETFARWRENLDGSEAELRWDSPFGKVLDTRDLIAEWGDNPDVLIPTLSDGSARAARIEAIRVVDSVEVQCIRVDSPDHSYVLENGIVTHNTGSDHSAVVQAAGGQVASLDELSRADGIFDPIRFSASKDTGVDMAVSMLMSINPWGSSKDDMEVPLQYAIHHGVAKGAECIGQALTIAQQEIGHELPPHMIEMVFRAMNSSPMFRACVGMNPSTTGLRAANGITLIKVGDGHLDLPEPGVPPSNIQQRIAAALVRMMIFGSAMALTGRAGVVMLDEAWVFLGAGASEVQRLGRLARSQQVLPLLFTQRVTDALDAGLAGFISRGIILPIEDAAEAKAACELFKLEPTPERIAKITAKGTKSSTNDKAQVPNWDSMRALRDPRTGKVLRGSIAIYSDMHGRAVPVENTLSAEFLELASTNPEDIRRREERARAAQAGAD